MAAAQFATMLVVVRKELAGQEPAAGRRIKPVGRIVHRLALTGTEPARLDIAQNLRPELNPFANGRGSIPAWGATSSGAR